MEIKAVFFDIDGTFYDHDNNQVLPETIEACKQLKENGYKIVLCSGRPKEMADDLNVFDLLEWDGYIGCSGGVAFDENYEIVYEDCYSEEQLTQMYTIAKQQDMCLYSFGKYEFINQPKCSIIEQMMAEFHLREPEVRDWQKEKLTAVTLIRTQNFDMKPYQQIEGISYTSSTAYGIDFVKDGVNKANGIKQMMKRWGFKENVYVAFGDSLNDVEMLKHASVGVAMQNGHEDTKAAADIICGPANEASIAKTLKQLKLI